MAKNSLRKDLATANSSLTKEEKYAAVVIIFGFFIALFLLGIFNL